MERIHSVLRLESGDSSFDNPVHVRAVMEQVLKDGLTPIGVVVTLDAMHGFHNVGVWGGYGRLRRP